MEIRRLLSNIYKEIYKRFSGYGLGNFYPFKILNNYIISRLKSRFAIIDNHKMFLDSKDSLNLSIYGCHEPFDTELVKKEIKEGDVVLDLGANIGYYTLIFAKLVGPEGRVIAFEPEPDNFSLLEKNVKINGYNNVVLVKKAASDKAGKLKLYLSESNKGDHRIYNSHDGRNFIKIDAVRLDDYFKNHKRPIDFIKIDTQGAEARIIAGARRMLQNNKNIKILTEFWPVGLQRSGANPKAYLNLLLKLGFNLHHIKSKVEPVSIAKLIEIYTPERGNKTDLFCTRY